MRIFRRKALPELTTDAYKRWLRAHRPPWLFFLGLSELEQESLARLGDEWVATCAQEVVDQTQDVQDEDSRVQTAAARALAALTPQAAAPMPQERPVLPVDPAPSRSMAGVTRGREEAQTARERQKANGVHLFNRAPDEEEATQA